MSRPNWFLAFPVAGAFVLDLPQLPANFRRFHPDDVHLTLAFLGTCGEGAAERALAALDRRLAQAPLAAIDASLGEVVPMGSRHRYTNLSALLGVGREEAAACIGSMRDELVDAAGAPRDLRPPKPHLSLARPRRRATRSNREAGLRWASALDLGGVRVRLDRIALYTWSEDRAQRLFRIVAERRLE